MVRKFVTYFAPRTCTEIGKNDSREEVENSPSLPLENFREVDAYVLLGSPGAGKTTVFKHEAEECENGHYVTARDFITLGDNKPKLYSKTLFIDGLDEIRAGSADGRTPFDEIRAILDKLGYPRFRLSCRAADWFGTNDRNHLAAVSRGGEITVLRLDPLSNDATREILHDHPGISDTDDFINTARERGIGALLRHPQSLRMLADAVAGEDWPETRRKTFERACEKLAHEHNSAHKLARQDHPSVPEILTAAGRLCAVQLLTGSAGYTLPGNEGNREYPGLEQIPCEKQNTLRHALHTRLFESPSEGRVVPVHRQIAEFLAARYLTNLIDKKGLPVGRILALVTGHDGGIVSELRGFSAWLAAHSKRSRLEIIARDPLGTILYGDIQRFSTDEKRQLLDCMRRETQRNPWFWRMIRMDSRLGDLATPDMKDIFQEALNDPGRDGAQQSLILILLESLKHGQILPVITDLMTEIVRDERWWPRVRRSALDVLIRYRKNGKLATTELKKLLTDVHTGSVLDSKDDLLGFLLRELYPGELSASDIWQYLRMPKDVHYFGAYKLFWTTCVPEKSTNTQLVKLLDALVERFDQLRSMFVDSPGQVIFLNHVPAVLLGRLLKETPPEEISSDRLFEWLRIVSDRELQTPGEDTEAIREWLTHNPDVQKEIMKLGLKDCTGSPKVIECMYFVEHQLFNAEPPADFSEWCLEQAISQSDHNIAEWLEHKAAFFVYNYEQRLGSNTDLPGAFTKKLADLKKGDALERQRQNQHETEMEQHRREWHDSVKPHETALRENRCKPAILHQLAKVYFGRFIDIGGKTPRDRFQNILGDDESLIEAVLVGLLESVHRDDIPDAAEIIGLATQNRSHYLALPFLVGLEKIPKNEHFRLTGKQMSQALAFHYTMPVDQKPDWYKRLLRSHPDVVSDVFIRYAHSQVHGRPPTRFLYELAFDQDHVAVARLAAMPLLEKFPVRCTKSQLPDLSDLLWAALLHCEQEPFLELVDRKLSYSSMNVAQRVYWLVAGLFASPISYCEKLESYIAGNKRRTGNLAKLVVETGKASFPQALIERLDVAALQLLIRLLGAFFGPRSIGVPDQVRNFIDQLASRASEDAAEALHDLTTDDHLQSWSAHLTDAAYRQDLVQREADFRLHHCDIDQVLATLDNLKPANAADLAALTFEYLREIASRIRDGNTSDWRQYWNLDQKRPEHPRHEDLCRDTLLSDLETRMNSLNIEAQPEGRYADDKRSDIRVSYGYFNVPVEIKKSNHTKLWSAINKQLIPKYVRDPGTEGYGIYLVFWFGREFCQAPPSGLRPRNATELEKRLLATLSEDKKRKIKVCVIDVAKPPTR